MTFQTKFEKCKGNFKATWKSVLNKITGQSIFLNNLATFDKTNREYE